MADLIPFRALRPTPASASRVAAVPYDVVNAQEAHGLASGNPLSFLHVSRAEIDLPPDTDPYSDTVYRKAVENFTTLKGQAPLVVEDVPGLYVYRLTMGSHVQTGIAGTFSIDEYDRDIIKKHERTRRDKEDDRTRHMLDLRAQTGPVFLTYKVSAAIDMIVERTAARAPLFDFAAPDGVRHTIWRVEGNDVQALVAAFGAIRALYIADGHHRAASAARARQQLRGTNGDGGEWDTVLAVAFPDNQVQILPYNRVVKDLGSHTPQSLLAKLREQFTVKEGPATPSRKGEVAMFLDGTWYTIALGEAPAGLPAADRLDVSRLQDTVLTPLLGIGDVRTDKRIDFVGGARGTAELEKLVKSGKAAVAFSLYPVSVNDLMQISDAGGIMPPKSTWFEPKLRDGLLLACDLKVLIADQFEPIGIDGIAAAGCEVIYQPGIADQALADAIASTGADVLVVRSTKVTEAMLAGGALSLVVRAGAGVNTIDVAAASRRGIYVSNCPGKNSIAVAELTFGLILALDRRIADCAMDLRAGKWNKKEYSKARGLFGRTLGIIGYGSIGQEVAHRAAAFGMPVVVWSRRFTMDPGSAGLDPRISVLDSPELVAERADVLTVHLALTTETRNFIGASIVNRLRPGSYFVNTSRGEIVDHAALADAVRARSLRVALDVFAQEPAGSTGTFEDPLIGLPNVIGTHHIGASTDQAQEAIAAEAARIIRAYKETGKVPNVVNLATKTPATHMLVVRHRDRPGVLAHVFDCLRAGNLNVQETENIIFEGAQAAIARINLDGDPSAELLRTISHGNQDILNLYVVKI